MTARRALAAGGALLVGALVLAAPLSASAHVHVNPAQATAGSATDLVFTVPNESDTANTTAVRITVPQQLGAVTPAAVRGWSVKQVAEGGRTSAIEYRATAGGVGQGAAQDFTVRIAKVPAVGSVALPVAQTYSDGSIVRWNQPTPASGAEPEHPVPVLYVQDAPPTSHDATPTPSSAPDVHGVSASTTQADSALPVGLSAAALVVSIGALAVAVVGLLRRR